MVEYSMTLDSVFGSLSDPTRRDILQRLGGGEMTVSQIALPYKLTFAAVSKHLMVLEKAKLISKRRRGKEQLVSVNAQGLADADKYLQQYKQFWQQQLDSLDKYLKQTK